MDNLVGEPPDGAHGLNILEEGDWQQSQDLSANGNANNTLLYIAVEYVKGDYKIGTDSGLSPTQTFTDFQQHVSPLDPNMSSVARYSPVYNEPSTDFNPVVIQQLVASNENEQQDEQFDTNIQSNSPLDGMPTVLCNDINGITSGVDSQYLQLVDSSDRNSEVLESSGLQNLSKNEQEVEILITDEATGISYSVSTQELLVERCLDDQQFLDSLTPGPLLDSDLLTIDDNTLKNNLPEDLMATTVVNSVDNGVVSSLINSFSNSELKRALEAEVKKEVGENVNIFDEEPKEVQNRRRIKSDLEREDQIFSPVYSISDKPILSRARASLPEAYLVINKINEEFGVFAKRMIVKRTQFGPITGIIKNVENVEVPSNKIKLLIEDEAGKVVALDTNDENESNWMCFVRKAQYAFEQNLVVSQHGNSLYFTATRNINVRQELKVGYSAAYATKYNLPFRLEETENSWPCYECSQQFSTSDELQNHLNVHDEDMLKDKPNKVKKIKKKLKKKRDALQCNICKQAFFPPKFSILKNHLFDKHDIKDCHVEEHFSVVKNYKCGQCDHIFNSEDLLKIHSLLHNPDSSDEQTIHKCPRCLRKFPTQRQLALHVSQYALPQLKTIPEYHQCSICSNTFSHYERLQRHMLVHGPDDLKPLQCPTCKKRFMNNSALTCHLKTHSREKNIYECPICKETFDHVLKLKMHVPIHCINNLYSCPYCPKVFKMYSIIRKHIRAFHSEKKYNCPHCSKHFPTIDKLRMHLLRHSDHREFLCADCGKQFKRKDKLKEHCKRIHSEERENATLVLKPANNNKKFVPKVEPSEFHRFIYKCHTCMVGFKRRGMLVNHLAKRHPDVSPDSVPELNLPILRTTRDYYCQYCEKVYKSSSKRKAHILKNHPGAELPLSNRKQGPETGLPNPTFSQTVGSITTQPQNCQWCHKQYASKAKLLQHQRKKHFENMSEEHKKDEAGVISEDLDLELPNNICKNPPLDEIKICHILDKNGELHCDCGLKYKTMEASNKILENEFRPTEEMLSSEIEEFVDDPDPNAKRYVILSGNDNGAIQGSNSHLYRLLTTTNSLVPPR